MKTYQATLKEIIAIKCLECMGGEAAEILDCTALDCPLYHVKPESRPDAVRAKYWHSGDHCLKALPVPRKRVLSEEQLQASRERIRLVNAHKDD